MAIHEEVLAAARRLCQARGSWSFSPADIVDALPHLNERSVRTHVVSRCCANAPSHHAHRWAYFQRLERGVYEIRADYRDAEPLQVANASATYELATVTPRQSIHAVVVESEDLYVAECSEIAIVTQGATLDETLAHLRDAVDLHMADEDPRTVGVVPKPRLQVTLEVATGRERS